MNQTARLSKWRLAALVLTALTVSLAMAQNVHLKQKREPTFVDSGLFLQTAGALAGLGGGDVVISLSATGNPTSTCTNPSGATQPPGQNPAPITVTGTQIIPEEEIKNGNVTFNVRTTSPVTPVPGAPGCPNPQWTQSITDMSFTSATITVEQPAGTTVLTLSCTFNPSTSNGSVAPSSVTCV